MNRRRVWLKYGWWKLPAIWLENTRHHLVRQHEFRTYQVCHESMNVSSENTSAVFNFLEIKNGIKTSDYARPCLFWPENDLNLPLRVGSKEIGSVEKAKSMKYTTKRKLINQGTVQHKLVLLSTNSFRWPSRWQRFETCTPDTNTQIIGQQNDYM